ncbi:MAG TPA: ABC transporter permease [Candidatus Obscuribacterales bacterium]
MLSPRQVRVNSGSSQLQNPQAFVMAAIRDLKSSPGIAKRLFLQGIAQRYRYSTLGIFWAFAPSVVTAVLLTLGQRSQIPNLSESVVPPQAYGIFGLLMAQTFLEALNSQRTFFSKYRHLLIRQKIPIEGLILACLAECIFGVLVRLLVLIAIFILFNVTPALTAPLSLVCFAMIISLGASLGLLLAPWNVLSRDLDNIMNFVPWILFATTPVFVAVKLGSWLYRIYQLNPLTHIFEAARRLAYGVGEITIVAILLLPVSVLLLILGWLFCRLCLPYVMERSLT